MRHHKIKKVLIANRGEIARRVQRACRELKIATVSIASEVDRNALFAREAEELVVIGPAPARESYLNIERILNAARERGCDAIHPGYGFLSENEEFARRVEEAGLIFIGPHSKTIALMGSKTAARAAAVKADVSVTSGSESGLSDQELLEAGERIGYPVIIKATAGGGGRGMRTARSREELAAALPLARAEVKKNFGSDSVFLEKFIERPRHVEVQVFGDKHGNVVHFGTRDCSTQRRHQKLIEEAPAPFLTPRLRKEIEDAAVRVAKAAGYYNAGTCEFLVKDGEFFFLEMNTRIQVEHPVTEQVTGVDLVQLQIRVARGEKLPMTQRQICFRGHAIEFRVNAEDVRNNFAPARGKIITKECPSYPFLREDYGYEAGDEIPLHYDGLVSKLVVTGRNRTDAIKKSIVVLSRYTILGVPTSLDLGRVLLENGVFTSRTVDIAFIEREFSPSLLEQALKDLSQGGGAAVEGRPLQDQAGARDRMLRELKNIKLRDPLHRVPFGGAVSKNCYEYQSEKFNTTYTIEVVHRSDGFFLAIPVDSKGRRAANRNCRMSNGLDKVVTSLIHDVLEKTPPAELFSN